MRASRKLRGRGAGAQLANSQRDHKAGQVGHEVEGYGVEGQVGEA